MDQSAEKTKASGEPMTAQKIIDQTISTLEPIAEGEQWTPEQIAAMKPVPLRFVPNTVDERRPGNSKLVYDKATRTIVTEWTVPPGKVQPEIPVTAEMLARGRITWVVFVANHENGQIDELLPRVYRAMRALEPPVSGGQFPQSYVDVRRERDEAVAGYAQIRAERDATIATLEAQLGDATARNLTLRSAFDRVESQNTGLRELAQKTADQECVYLKQIAAKDARIAELESDPWRVTTEHNSGDYLYHGPTKPTDDGGRIAIPDPAHEQFHRAVGDVLAGNIMPAARRQMQEALQKAPKDAPTTASTSAPMPDKALSAPADQRLMGFPQAT